MMSDISIGDRVQLSAFGVSRCPRQAVKTRTVVGRGTYRNSVVILFDGNKCASTLHRDYVEVILPCMLEARELQGPGKRTI